MTKDSKMTEFSTCRHFSLCSGCQIQRNFSSPPIWKEILNYFTPHQISPALFHGEMFNWRTRVKLAVRKDASHPKIGLFKANTHEVIEILDCPMHYPPINQALEIIKKTIQENQMCSFDEKNLTGLLRYLQCTVERKSNKIQLVLVFNAQTVTPLISRFVDDLKTKMAWHSIWVNLQFGATNSIFGKKWILCEGEEFLQQTCSGVDLFFHPSCFSQAHLSLYEQAVDSILGHLLPNRRLVEYYAGVGSIGLSLVSLSSQVICIEVNPFARQCFEKAKDNILIDQQRKITFKEGLSSEWLSVLDHADVVVLDPPRKGVEKPLIEAICTAKHLEQIVYLSCYFPSFQRDAQALLKNGWIIDTAEGYLFFPGTNHVETLTFFRKKASG